MAAPTQHPISAATRALLAAACFLTLAPLCHAQTDVQLPDAARPSPWTSTTATIPATNSITAAGANGPLTINGTSQVAFTAGAQINLEPGFTATAPPGATGITFRAAITPIVMTYTLPSGTVGRAYLTALAAIGGNSPYTWSLASGSLPPGLNLSTSGAIGGTPTAAGVYTPIVKVTGNDGAWSTGQLSVTISPEADFTVSISPQSVSAAPGGTAQYIVTVNPVAGLAQPVTLSPAAPFAPVTSLLWNGYLPGPITVNSPNWSATLTAGISQSAGNGTSWSIQITATSGSSTRQGLATLNITGSPTISVTVTPSSPPNLTAGGSLQFAASVVGTGNTAVTWSRSPAVGTIDSTTGLYAAPASVASSTTVTITATSQADSTKQGFAALTVTPAVPTLSISSSAALPDAPLNSPYSQSLAATGGTPPYSWTVQSWPSSPLPAGLTLTSDGVLSGTPTAAGSNSFTLTVTDSGNPRQNASRLFSTTIGAMPDLGQMAVLELFVLRHTWLTDPSTSVEESNGGLYGLPDTDLSTVNSLVATAADQLAQVQSQASTYTDGFAYLNAKNAALQSLNTQLQSRVSPSSWQSLSDYMTYTLSGTSSQSLNSSTPAQTLAPLAPYTCNPGAANCEYMWSEINFYNGGASNSGLGTRLDSFVEGVNAREFTSQVRGFELRYCEPNNGPCSTVDRWDDRSASNGVPVAAPRTVKDPKRGTYTVTGKHYFLQRGVQVAPKFTNVQNKEAQPEGGTWDFTAADGTNLYSTPVDLGFKIDGTRFLGSANGSDAFSCSEVTVSAAMLPNLPAGNQPPPLVWTGGTDTGNNRTRRVRVPCETGTSVTVSVSLGRNLSSTLTLYGHNAPTVSISPATASGKPLDVLMFTATGSPAPGTFRWTTNSMSVQFVEATCVSGSTSCVPHSNRPHTCNAADPPTCTSTEYVQILQPGTANVSVYYEAAQARSPTQSARVSATPAPVPPSVQLTSNGSSVQPGQCVYLDPAPGMPELTARLVSSDGQPVTGTVNWNLTVEFDELLRDGVPHHKVAGPLGPYPDVSASQPYQLSSPQTPVFGGGAAKVNWSFNGVQQTPFQFCIRGTNPSLSAAQAELSTSDKFWFMWNTAVHETNGMNFCESPRSDGAGYCRSHPEFDGLPVWGKPGGYGIIQYDADVLNGAPEPSLSVLWDWKQNAAMGQTLAARTAGPIQDITTQDDRRAYPFWLRQVRQWQLWNSRWNSQIPLEAANIRPAPAQDSGSCHFRINPIPSPGLLDSPITGQPGTYWFGDATLIKQYNGAPTNYVSWNGTVDGNQFWNPFNLANAVNQDVVHDVCTCSTVAACEHHPIPQ